MASRLECSSLRNGKKIPKRHGEKARAARRVSLNLSSMYFLGIHRADEAAGYLPLREQSVQEAVGKYRRIRRIIQDHDAGQRKLLLGLLKLKFLLFRMKDSRTRRRGIGDRRCTRRH